MPPSNKKTTDTAPSRPATWQKNADVHPGADAEKKLHIHHDPDVIHQEKLKCQARKEAKEHHQEEEVVQKEAAQHHLEKLQSQQAADLAEEETKARQQSNSINTNLC